MIREVGRTLLIAYYQWRVGRIRRIRTERDIRALLTLARLLGPIERGD